jgi:hypothetical protein
MSDSLVRAVVARKQIVIAGTAFAVLIGSLSATMPSAFAQIDLETISVDISDGDISISFDDSYVRISDGDISISLGELLSGLGGGFAT